DPIEYVHNNKRCIVDQREVGVDCPDFETALRSALREDPDVLLVGEMRDLESIRMALTIAETGHLVFGTLHTNDTSQTVSRMQTLEMSLSELVEAGLLDRDVAVGVSMNPTEIARPAVAQPGRGTAT